MSGERAAAVSGVGRARGPGARWQAIALQLGWLLAACATEPPPPDDPGDNVILITLDGVRSREVFGRPDPALSGGDEAPAFPLLFESLTHDGVIYGDPTRFEPMITANDAQVSIPGYMSMLTGYAQPCYDNECPPVAVETVLEYVQRVRRFEPGEVAVFASWAKMGRAIESVVGTITSDIGPAPDAVDVPDAWPDARWDRDTFDAAMSYLETERPRLLYISLLDSDGWGHADDYGEYLATLRQFDVWIAEVKLRLAAMGEYGARTTLIVTTDHGRGDGDTWTDHNSALPGSERVFLHAVGPHVAHGLGDHASARRSSADIRPTIEVLFGLPPSSCVRCGVPLPEVVGGVL